MNRYKAFAGEDSEEIYEGVWYCKKLNLYWKDGKKYDQLSAEHNGIIGAGLQLKQIIKQIKDSK